MKCIAKYKERLTIESVSRDYGVTMDAAPPLGQKRGMTPGELLLNALAGCKIMSLISLSSKEGIEIENIIVEVLGETGLMDEVSGVKVKEFKKIHTVYKIKADNSKEELEDFILKGEKFCTVGNSLKESIEKTTELIVE